jgi:hypothetical protein
LSTTQQPPRVFRSSPHHPGNKPEKNGAIGPGMIIVAAIGTLFVAYIFNFHGIATSLDRSLGNINQAAQSQQQTVATIFVHALPVIVGAMVLFLMLIFLRAGEGKKSSSKKQSADSRGIDAFVELASAEGISPKVSRSAYRVLLPFVRKNKYLGVDDSLFHDLKLREEQLSDVYGSLLRLSDRNRRRGDEGTGIRGVMGLMMAVESSEEKPAAGTITGKISRAHIANSVAGKLPAGPVAVGPVAVASTPRPVEEAKSKKPSAVLMHPARLARRELSMIRTRPLRG